MSQTRTKRIRAGLYEVWHGSRPYVVENISRDAGRKQWNISEGPYDGQHREAFDATDTLASAINLISRFTTELDN